ncbi:MULTISPECIES: helix-turn-helix transcriptional regulator [environmental samples]|uniref:helix-turn-helix domain-containing protein n=1 Tax=environmental samples TaxID=876090 RepID=UPI00033A4396|nr:MULTISPECIES: helix-turn-helix transcriptional regulator [environmental samples]CDC67917.1 putative uncharacterized protein [Oscillibacter sp. CAG:155]
MPFNPHAYFSINWESTKENLRDLMVGRISPEVLAEAMFVTPRTIRNWLNDPERPISLETLVLLSKFFDADLRDILVFQKPLPVTAQTLEELRSAERAAPLPRPHAPCDREFSTPESSDQHLAFLECWQEGMPIRSLEVFLLYLPLFHPYLLADVMGRLGGTPRRNHYLAENLKFLYDHIPDSPAKQYADWYRYYKLEPPTVDTVTDGSRTPEKLEKLEAWVQLQETPEYGAAYDDYRARLTSFQSRFLSGAEQAALLGEDGKW